ncbi:MAG: hypothetical protein NTW21_01595, partial [Verrucomicrobia bacterium]|nr:hypothetical protein [Verrucomicrobiota bacterium]
MKAPAGNPQDSHSRGFMVLPQVRHWLAGLVAGVALVSSQTQAARDLGAIMPVGDSITAGYSVDPNVMDAGWRGLLYNSLTAAGYS